MLPWWRGCKLTWVTTFVLRQFNKQNNVLILYILSPRIVKKYTTSLRIEMSLCLWINCKMWMTTWWPRFLVYCICFFEIYIYTQNRILVTKLYLGILNNYMYWCFWFLRWWFKCIYSRSWNIILIKPEGRDEYCTSRVAKMLPNDFSCSWE